MDTELQPHGSALLQLRAYGTAGAQIDLQNQVLAAVALASTLSPSVKTVH